MVTKSGAAEPGAASPPATVDLGALTHRLTSALQRAIRFALTVPDGDPAAGRLGPRHRAVMALLQPAGSRAVDLARESGQHKQVVGTLVDELEQLGYVRREPDPADRRGKLILPTDQGRAQMTHITAVTTQIEGRLAAVLGAQQYQAFKQSLLQVVAVLEDND